MKHEKRYNLRELGHLVDLRRATEAEIERAVVTAKQSGVSWQAIGDVLGVTRQSAHSKYKKDVFEADPSSNLGGG